MQSKSFQVVILGSTGSIGRQALEVAENFKDSCKILGLAGGNNLALLEQQVQKWHPKWVAIGNEKLKEVIQQHPAFTTTHILWGMEGLKILASLPDADLVIQALGGAIGIQPTIMSIQAGKRIGLANKETLVAAGEIVMPLAEKYHAEIIPVDSEHSAIFQCLQGEKNALKALWLTASGGPFYSLSEEELEKVSVEKALHHPRWQMGAKITIDSATMMNKGLEVIEAHHLFQMPYDSIEVLVHPESVIHSMIETVDSALLAQMGTADMRLPIQYAFTWPERRASLTARLSLSELGTLHFMEPDKKKFPALKMAYEVGKTGGTLPTVMNAANEIAVAAFLQRQIGFRDIYRITQKMVDQHNVISHPDLEEILEIDRQTRVKVNTLIQHF